ncbi:MAG: UdgX family uracil-DNA binding protein [Actinomycetota bacterium]|nr:UdgX family uracil-DNA binding protein [Actinomycetota bacterium]
MSAAEFVPVTRSLRRLCVASADCHGCELFEAATQTVFGSGPRAARIMLVGEQPGDVEDQQGRPFVGPAGRLLDRALAESGIDRAQVYLTNAVKHFRWKRSERGKRRIHDRPATRHIDACRPWLAAELGAVRPQVLVALGAVAAQSLFGPAWRLSDHRGQRLPWPPPEGPFAGDRAPIAIAMTTIHPSAALRAGPKRAETFAGLVRDLASVADRSH